MRNVRLLAALGLVAMAGVAQAEVSGSATIVSDYDWRGWTQTDYKPALQLGLDYSGGLWYVGTWASNVDFGAGSDPSTEVDFFGGLAGEFGESGLGWDVGFNYYTYPGASDINTIEFYGRLSYSVVTGAVWYTDDYFDSGESAYYLTVDASIPAGALSVDLHAGLCDGDAFDNTAYTDSYTDYSIGVSYSSDNFTLGLKWVTQDSDDLAASDDRVLLSFGTSFPWEK